MKRNYANIALLVLGLWLWMPAGNAQPRQDSLAIASLLHKTERAFIEHLYDSVLIYSRLMLDYSRSHNYKRGEVWGRIKRVDGLLEKDSLSQAQLETDIILKEARLLKDSVFAGIAYVLKGEAALYAENIDAAIPLFEMALKRLENVPSSYTGLCYNELGFAWGRKDREDRLIEYCLKGYEVYSAIGDNYGCAMTLGNVATSYRMLGQEEKAIDYSKRAIQYREAVGNLNALSLAYCNLGQQYLYKNIDSAARYQQRCLECAIASKSDNRMVNAYTTAALVSNEQGRAKDAYEYELKAVALLEKTRFDDWLLSSRYMTTAFYAERVNLDSATIVSYYTKSLKLAEQLKSKRGLQSTYRYMSGYYRRKSDYEKAYLYFVKSVAYKDSVDFEKQQKNVDELEAKYQTTRKDGEIQRLNGEQRIRLLQIEKQDAIINADRLVALERESRINLLTQQQQLRDLDLRQSQEAIEREQLESKNREQQLLLAQKEQELGRNKLQIQKRQRNGIIAGSALLLLIAGIAFSRYQLKKKYEQQAALQEMRNNIAGDLHDDIGASLSNINILNELTRRNADQPQKVEEYLQKASEDIKHVSEGISDIVWNINPRYDSLDQLFIRMKRYAADMFDAMNINYVLNFPEKVGNSYLDMNRRRDFYLLFKEAVNNLAKYSKATQASINLTIGQHQIGLTIEDNGVGFDQANPKLGNGLQNMEERARLLNGDFRLDSTPGIGTRLQLRLAV